MPGYGIIKMVGIVFSNKKGEMKHEIEERNESIAKKQGQDQG